MQNLSKRVLYSLALLKKLKTSVLCWNQLLGWPWYYPFAIRVLIRLSYFSVLYVIFSLHYSSLWHPCSLGLNETHSLLSTLLSLCPLYLDNFILSLRTHVIIYRSGWLSSPYPPTPVYIGGHFMYFHYF